jgi:ATP-dependent DNA ligase
LSQRHRRTELELLLHSANPPIHLTPMTRDRATALDWHTRFEGAGLDGVMVKPEDAAYQPGKRGSSSRCERARSRNIRGANGPKAKHT